MKSQLSANIDVVIKIASPFGFLLQLIPNIPGKVKTAVIILFVIIIVSALVHGFININKNIINRKTMIKRGKDIIQNTVEKVVLFSGDLSLG
jgi:hypothetical protein